MYTQQEAEGKRLKNPCDTITEGIGINRQTRNFSKACIDGAFQGTDREAVEMVSAPGLCKQYQQPTCMMHYVLNQQRHTRCSSSVLIDAQSVTTVPVIMKWASLMYENAVDKYVMPSAGTVSALWAWYKVLVMQMLKMI